MAHKRFLFGRPVSIRAIITRVAQLLPWAGNNLSIEKHTYSVAVQSDAANNGLLDKETYSVSVIST